MGTPVVKKPQKRREIDRHHHWKPGHDPSDDDAHPDSPWLYAKLEEAPPPPEGPKINGTSGPPAGMKCVVVDSCQAPMYVLDSYTPQEALEHLDTVGGDFVFPKKIMDEDRMLALACSNGHTATFKESLLPARQRALGRKV